MTNLIYELTLLESQRIAEKELQYTSFVVNKIFKEWKKIQRRRNAVDLVSTSTNALARLNIDNIKLLTAENKAKLAIIISRCLDLPVWASINTKEKIYKKLFNLISLLENEIVPTMTNSTLRDVIATRFSARIGYKINPNLFVSYEKIIPLSYLEFLFGSKIPSKVYRMKALPLPEDFEELINLLTANYNRCLEKFKINK